MNIFSITANETYITFRSWCRPKNKAKGGANSPVIHQVAQSKMNDSAPYMFYITLNGDMSCSQLGFHCVQNDFISGLSFSSYPCVFHWVWWVRSLEDWAVWLSCGHLTESLNGSNWRKTDVWAIKASLAMLGHSPIRLLTVHVKPTVAQSAGLPLEHCRWTAVGSNTMWNTLTPSYPLHLSSRS